MTLHCKNRMIKFEDSPWQPAVVGVNGEYLLALQDGFNEFYMDQHPEFDLVVPADGGLIGQSVDFGTFNAEVKLFFEETAPVVPLPGERLLQRHHFGTIAELHSDAHRPPIFWEFYCGGARVSKIAESMGMLVEEFSYETGWDFNQKEHQSSFFERLRTEMPDEVYLAPDCHLWSQMQNLAARTEDQQLRLIQSRTEHHNVHLRFVAEIYFEQIMNARHAHIEQPEHAKSWRTGALRDLPGFWSCFDQCAYGSLCADPYGEWLPVKKGTAILTSKLSMHNTMNKRCDGLHHHCHLEGSAPGYGRRTTYMAEYQPGLAASIAAAIFAPDPPQCWEFAHAVDEQRQVQGQLVKLYTESKSEAIRTVQRLHRGLGHPSTTNLVELLESRQASKAVLEAARHYQCAACLRYKKPNQVAPSSINQPRAMCSGSKTTTVASSTPS